jgi:hypothetical protein
MAIVAYCIVQSAQKVADTALNFLMDSGLACFFTENARVVLTTLYDALAKASRCHWNHDVRDSARAALATASKFDPRMFREIARSSEQKPGTDDVKLQIWALIAHTAAKRDVALRLGARLSEIIKVFRNRAGPMNDVLQARRGSIAVAARGPPPLPAFRRATGLSPAPPIRPISWALGRE